MRTHKILRGITKHLALIIFVIIYVALALLTYKDFGTTWDEPLNYNRGVVTYEHVFNKIVEHPFRFNKTQGHLDVKEKQWELPYIKRYLNISATRLYSYYRYSGFYPMILFILNKDKHIESYHLLNILFSLGIFIALYALLYHHYRDQKKAILGPIFLFLTPRFLGHIPGNPKDIPFAVMYFISCTALYFFASNKNLLTKILVLGLLIGITQNLRMAGITLCGIVVLFDTYTYYLSKQDHPSKADNWSLFLAREVQTVILIGMIALTVSVLTWPYLGMNVIPNIKEILLIKKNIWKGTTLYQGTELQATKLPGHYLVTWFAITTPLITLIPTLFSPLIIKKRFHNRLFMLFFLILVTNVILYAIIQPLIYDGLRHFLFLVPFIAALGVTAIIEFFQKTKGKLIRTGVALLILANLVVVSRQMIILHPYQYVFFNSLVGGLQGAHKKYDTDYWGASYNEALKWFKENIATDNNRRYAIHIWGIKGYKVHHASNIKNVPLEIADYIFRFTRRMPEEPKKEDILHIIEREGVPLVYIMKNNDTSKPIFTKKAREILLALPEENVGFTIKYAKQYAQEKGYPKVTRETIVEQLKGMGLKINEGITE